MSRKPRLVATDLDGTLLRSDGSVSAYSLDVLDRARRAGIEVLAVTARSPLGIDEIAAASGLTGNAIVSNGSVLYDIGERRVLSSSTITAADAREAAEEALAVLPDVGFAVTTGLRMVADPLYGAYTKLFATRRVVDVLDELWETEHIVRLYMHSRTLDTDGMFERVAGLASRWVHAGGGSMLEFGAPGVSKASALRAYCEERGIAAEEVAAFGDMPSDLEMLAWAGRPHAVANAHPAVLAAVTGRAPANDDDGVARVVEGLLQRHVHDR
ncbi:MAG TPA: HAD-IIB family hydrolase [Phytomonospora sp.]